jgi:hypothetical protein
MASVSTVDISNYVMVDIKVTGIVTLRVRMWLLVILVRCAAFVGRGEVTIDLSVKTKD